jgi:2-C-methyl-D-erythritol 4-phosphate cytidylyltransferase
MEVTAVVPAAGLGRRMGTSRPKQFLSLGGMSVVARVLLALQESPVDRIQPVAPADHLDDLARLIRRRGFGRVLPPVAGGERRQDSVRAGLAALPPSDLVLIHDGARPLVTPDLVRRCLEAAREAGAAVAAIRPHDTVKLSDDGRLVTRTLDRSRLWLIQTPQAFRRAVLEDAYRRVDFSRTFTDEASLAEAAGFPVRLVEGSPENLKITTPLDLVLAGAILRSRRAADA